MSGEKRFRDEIPEILKQFETLSDFLQVGDPNGSLMPQFSAVLHDVLQEKWRILQKLHVEQPILELSEFARWKALAANPKKFDAELERIFSAIRSFMKRRHGISDHRPTKNSERDAKIYRLKRNHPQLNFAQIGDKCRVAKKVAETAYKRQLDLDRRALGRFLQEIADAEDLLHPHETEPQK